MVRFELYKYDGISYSKVILDDKSIIGTISVYGFRLSQRQDNSLTMKSKDLKVISIKVKEVEKFGMNIPVCEYCKGTPGFPQNGCEAGNHGLLDEN